MQTAQFQLHADIEERHWWFVGRRRIMARLVSELVPMPKCGTAALGCEALSAQSRATVLQKPLVVDIGCGTGANVAALAGLYDCVGIDASAEAVELARRRFPQVRFVAGLAPDDLGETMRQAKLFLLMDVLEHVEDDFLMLSKLLAAAAPGSHFLLTVPADELLWSEHDESFGHYRRYDAARLKMLWEGLPVSTLLLSNFNSRLLPAIRFIRRGTAAAAALPAGRGPISGYPARRSIIFYANSGGRRRQTRPPAAQARRTRLSGRGEPDRHPPPRRRRYPPPHETPRPPGGSSRLILWLPGSACKQ